MNPCLIDFIASSLPARRATREVRENPMGPHTEEIAHELAPYRRWLDLGKSPYEDQARARVRLGGPLDELGVATGAGIAAGALELTMEDRPEVALTTSIAAMAMAEVQLELYWQAVQFSQLSDAHPEPVTGNPQLDDWLRVAHAPTTRYGFSWENANLPFIQQRNFLYAAYTGGARGRWEVYAQLLAMRYEEHDRPYNAATFVTHRWVHELNDNARRIMAHRRAAHDHAARAAHAALLVINNAMTIATRSATGAVAPHQHLWGVVGAGMAVVGGLYTQHSRATKDQRDTLRGLADFVYSVAGAGRVESTAMVPPPFVKGKTRLTDYPLKVLEQAIIAADLIAERGMPRTFRSLAAVLAEVL